MMRLDGLPDDLHALLCGLVEAWACPGMVIPDGTPKQVRLRDLMQSAGPAFWQWDQIDRPLHPVAVQGPAPAVKKVAPAPEPPGKPRRPHKAAPLPSDPAEVPEPPAGVLTDAGDKP